MTRRLITQIAATSVLHDDGAQSIQLYALDDDGKVWVLEDPSKHDMPSRWAPLPELPGIA